MAKKKRKKRRKRQPSPKQIQEGLYLDVEGFAPRRGIPRPPVLCGYRIGNEGPVKQVVFTRRYFSAARASGLETSSDRKHFFLDLMKDTKGRKLFAFTEHEQNVIKQATGFQYRKKYRNAHAIAKRWVKREFPRESTRGLALIDYLRLAGIKVPTKYGKDKVTDWLREVRRYSVSQAKWKKAPASARKAWDNILAHNQFDITAMGELMEVIQE